TIRESFRNGNYFLPFLNGVPNPYKPPLIFWIGMAAESIVPESLFMERLPSVLFAAGTAVLVFRISGIFGGQRLASFTAGFIYILTVGVFKFSRLVMMEQAMAFFLSLCTYFILMYIVHNRKKYIVLAGLCAGAGFLLKGPVLTVYAGTVLFVWGVLHFFRFRFAPFQWKGRKYLHRMLSGVLLFFIPAAFLPVLYYIVLTLYADNGIGIVKFFLFIENIGKFSNENQPELAIFLGAVFYLFPWSIAVSVLAFRLLFQRIRKPRALLGIILTVSSAFILLIHILPNRKDAYYSIPALPLLISGVFIKYGNYIYSFKNLWKMNAYFSLLILFLTVSGAFFLQTIDDFGISPFFSVAVLFMCGSVLFLKISYVYRNILVSFLILAFFQFYLLRKTYLPLIPEDLNLGGKSVCILSENSWNLFDAGIFLPGSRLYYSAPSLPENCPPDSPSLLALGTHRTPDSRFEKKRSWKIWKPHS
ncbi:MAG TPA: glycosyltransferase family 39 protein, partial [Leptospiraceae bacterium]|nr:glycosyltransferase family 39 protein [Leptospiraceae bacterium]